MRALAVGLWVVAAAWAARVVIALLVEGRARWSVSPDDAPRPDPADPLVSVLIPARDEEATIGACLAAVLAQDHRTLEVLVADDQSADATAAVARRVAGDDPRARVFEAPPPEPGWTGKSAALWAAQAQARGEWLLFLDADVRLHPRAVSAAIARARRDGAGMASWLGRLELGSFWERTVLPVMADLIARWAPVWLVNRPGSRRCLANGQFLLFRREVYDAVGGHRAVRAEVAEDVALCRRVKELAREPGVADPPLYRLYRARTLMTVRMYRSLRAIWLGFAKNAYAALGESAIRVAGAVGAVLALDVAPWLVALAAVASPPLAAARLPAVLAVLLTIVHRVATARHASRLSPFALLHPLGALVVAGILADSALRGTGLRAPASWKGRPGGMAPADRN